MPGFPIVDTHVHLIDPEVVPLRWGNDAPTLNRRHLMGELDQARQAVEIEQLVMVEVDVVENRYLDEVSMVSDLAMADHRIAAMVAHAPLERGDSVQADLDELAANPLVKGVRRLIQGEADPQWCLNRQFVAGVRRLEASGLHFEICIYHWQAAAAVELARLCPNVRFVLDHIGKPAIKEGLLDPWRAHIRSFAELPNVTCKLSGLVTEADHRAWRLEDLRVYVDHVVESFGFDRLMFGSDWPVATLASTYPRWVDTLDRLLAGVSTSDLTKFYRDNAKKVYRLN